MSHEVAGCLLSDCILPPLHRYIMYIHTHTYIHTYGCTYCTRYLTAFSSRFPPRGHPCACVLQGGVQGRVGVLVRCRGGLHGLPQHTSTLRRVPPGDFLRRAESQSTTSRSSVWTIPGRSPSSDMHGRHSARTRPPQSFRRGRSDRAVCMYVLLPLLPTQSSFA